MKPVAAIAGSVAGVLAVAGLVTTLALSSGGGTAQPAKAPHSTIVPHVASTQARLVDDAKNPARPVHPHKLRRTKHHHPAAVRHRPGVTKNVTKEVAVPEQQPVVEQPEPSATPADPPPTAHRPAGGPIGNPVGETVANEPPAESSSS